MRWVVLGKKRCILNICVLQNNSRIKFDALIEINKIKRTHKFLIICEMAFLPGSEQGPTLLLLSFGILFIFFFFKDGCTGHFHSPHKHPHIQILFTIQLATVNTAVIIGGNQMLNPSAVLQCLQVLNLILCLGMCVTAKPRLFMGITRLQRGGMSVGKHTEYIHNAKKCNIV